MQPEVVVLGWDISYYRPWVQLVICVCGTFAFHILHGIALERLFRLEGTICVCTSNNQGFVFGWWLTFIQFVTYAVLAGRQSRL
jgi:hypothetical protein